MGRFKEYLQYDGLGLAELIRKGDVSPVELCEEAIARIEETNPRVNAVIFKMFDIGRKTAAGPLPDGPFRGVPFLLKDLEAPYAGVPMQCGSKAYRNYIPSYDGELVKRFKDAGLVTLGKTNTPEFGLVGFTEPEAFGATRNPWNEKLTPGGSSGGSGAAVAAGMVPLASGGDGGGSIRIPSSHCGLFGLKPSRGRVPTGPHDFEKWQGAVVNHALTRSVRDSAVLLDSIEGMDKGSRVYAPKPAIPYAEEIKRDPGKLRIAFCTDSPVGKQVHPECREAISNTAKLLESLGHIVEEKKPGIDMLALSLSYVTMYYGEVAAAIHEAGEVLGRTARPEDVEAVTWTLGLLGKAYSAEDFVLALREWDRAARIMAGFHETYDLYLTPTVAFPPVEIGSLKPKGLNKLLMGLINAGRAGGILKKSGVAVELALNNLEKTPYTQLANLTGQPAMSVPLHWTQDGLPIGSQFIAPYGGEGTLFRLAAQLEQARPWFHKRPSSYA